MDNLISKNIAYFGDILYFNFFKVGFFKSKKNIYIISLIVNFLLVSDIKAQSKITMSHINQTLLSSDGVPSKAEYLLSLQRGVIESSALVENNNIASLEESKQSLTFSALAGSQSIELLNIETVEPNLVSSGSNQAFNHQLSLPDLVKIGLNYKLLAKS